MTYRELNELTIERTKETYHEQKELLMSRLELS